MTNAAAAARGADAAAGAPPPVGHARVPGLYRPGTPFVRAPDVSQPVKPAVMDVNCQLVWLIPEQLLTTPPPAHGRSRLTAQ